ncbi:MAG TPA: chorismate mutase [Vicinamibacterales bacterium]|nr:chorismate mutase [Vicinamibacterales bacterium]
MTTIDDLRRRIDEIDAQLVRLLNARAECALTIGQHKKAAGMELYQPERETEVLTHVQAINAGPLDNPAMKRLFERVIDEARRLERLADLE